MHVSHLSARGLRNLAPLDLDLDARITLFVGANGQGKTNLLEAVYLAATGRSFRLAPVAEMIAHGRASAHVAMAVARAGARHDVEVRLGPRSRQVVVDGRQGRHARHLFALVNVVAFVPDDLRIVKEGPERRRHFLDRAVANVDPAFVGNSLAYARANQARNALLRQPSAPDRALVAAYDRELARHGTALDAARRRFLADWRPAGEAFVGRLLPEGGEGGARLALRLTSGVPAWEGPGADEEDGAARAGALAADLAASYPRDRARGFGHVGPHRGDLHMELGGHPARQYASQGQQRAVVLALKLAEVAVLHRRLGAAPVVLLDDISSELDRPRTALLFALVAEVAGQALVTTTSVRDVPLPDGGATRHLEVAAGRVREVGADGA